jgi:hypothetical protein
MLKNEKLSCFPLLRQACLIVQKHLYLSLIFSCRISYLIFDFVLKLIMILVIISKRNNELIKIVTDCSVNIKLSENFII